jgi:FkbM family methyltransferase
MDRYTVGAWFSARGDETLRVNSYDLTHRSLVFDLGGYKGDFAQAITSRFHSAIHVFEPVVEYADNIIRRFAEVPSITVHKFGLAQDNLRTTVAVLGDASSVHKSGADMREIQLVKASQFFEEQGIERVDLMKINIEGGEYDLLEHLLATGLVEKLANIQIQFHDFVEDAPRRMRNLLDWLENTHYPTYQFRFVWENWRKRAP